MKRVSLAVRVVSGIDVRELEDMFIFIFQWFFDFLLSYDILQ